jgi:predicted O-methyltransferase YrrM
MSTVRLLKNRVVNAIHSLAGRSYPSKLGVHGANRVTLDFVATTDCRTIAEIGIYNGYSSEGLARFLDGRGELHLFDYDFKVSAVLRKLNAAGFRNVRGHPNSSKTLDSYNWSLMKVLQEHREPLYDYVFLDGAHTWNLDALAFLLVDRLLKVGGFVDFDDHSWSLRKSPYLNPLAYPQTAQQYTQEQIDAEHVRLILDLLVRRDPRYEEVVANKIFRKVRAS